MTNDTISPARCHDDPEGLYAVRFCMLTPIGWLGVFWALVLRARLSAGMWPHTSRGNPFDVTWECSPIDPGEFPIHYALAGFGLMAVVVAVGVGAMILLLNRPWPRRGILPSSRAAFVLGTAGVILSTLGDAGGFFLWFMD